MTTPDANVRNTTASTGRPGATGPRQDDGPDSLFSMVRGRIRTELNDRKNVVSQALDDVAETVRRVGAPLREQSSTLGGYAEDAAGRLRSFATTLRERDVAELGDDIKDLAQRYPTAFVAAGLAAGLMTARFLKSSSAAGEPRGHAQERATTGMPRPVGAQGTGGTGTTRGREGR